MKEKAIRFGSLLLIAALLLAELPMAAFAHGALSYDGTEPIPAEVDVERTADGQGGYEAMLESVEQLGGGEPLLSGEALFSAPAGAAFDGSMYEQLTARQKACYNVLESVTVDRLVTAAQVQYNNFTYRRIMVQVEGMTGSTMAGTIAGGVFRPSGTGVAAEKSLYTDMCAAIVALRYDRPDILWISTMRYGYRVTSSGSEAAKVTDVMFDFHLAYGGLERNMREDMMARAEAIAAEAATAPDTYSKVRAVHDALAAGNVYGDTNEDLSHTAYSALISGDQYEPVCDGYAKAFKIVCGLINIPCATPSSADHMWNNVKMENGIWYNLDLTWDDGGETVKYDYFLIGSQTEVNGEIFSKQKDHIEENPYDAYLADSGSLLNPVTLRFPAKSAAAYEYIGRDQEGPAFPDVAPTAWYFGAVEEAADLGLFQGDNKGYFNPSKNITRAEFAVVMSKALGADLTGYGGSDFTDVRAGDWYAPVVAWAKDTGVMQGDGNGKFRPNAPITRQEMCVVIYQTMKAKANAGSFRFSDDARISSWAKEAVYGCYEQGLVQGSNGLFKPRDNTLRCQAAVVFTAFVKLPNIGDTPDGDTENVPEDIPEDDTESVPEE